MRSFSVRSPRGIDYLKLVLTSCAPLFDSLRGYLKIVFFRLILRVVEAQFQIEAPDPYPSNKQRSDLGTLVVLSGFSSVTCIIIAPG